jgi:hypothetical protein
MTFNRCDFPKPAGPPTLPNGYHQRSFPAAEFHDDS